MIMRVLGIETSCDETGVAIYDSEQGLLAHSLYSQVELHQTYGGVVPELASRDHVKKLTPLVSQTLAEANLSPQELDGVAYTAGPGLVGALLVGASFARALAFSWDVPAVAVHHMEAHLLAPMLETPKPQYPFLALLVSGGHTQLMAVKQFGDYHLLGETLDDAAGEAFDKTAKLLGLPYPGGPELAKLAQHAQAHDYRFPRPMTDRPGLDFSFSGLKTYALNVWKSSAQDQQTKANIAHAFEEAIVETLSIKCKRAIEQTQIKQLVVAGGVSANLKLRHRLEKLMQNVSGNIFYPRLEFCTDNGAMVAYTGALYLEQGYRAPLAIEVKPRWPLQNHRL